MLDCQITYILNIKKQQGCLTLKKHKSLGEKPKRKGSQQKTGRRCEDTKRACKGRGRQLSFFRLYKEWCRKTVNKLMNSRVTYT